MRIGTWNVDRGVGSRNADRLKLIQKSIVDIWVLTETHSSLDLSKSHEPISSKPMSSRRDGSFWVTIWSRFPLLRQLSASVSSRMVAAIFRSPSGPIAVAGVVLPWQNDVGDEPTECRPKGWQEFQRVINGELPLFLKSLARESEGSRQILAGDFNTSLAKPKSYGPKRAVRDELANQLAEAKMVCHTADTISPQWEIPGTLIDHICTSFGNVDRIETWSGFDGGKPRLSDHPGVVVSLTS